MSAVIDGVTKINDDDDENQIVYKKQRRRTMKERLKKIKQILANFGFDLKIHPFRGREGIEQGRIHGYPSRLRVGRGSAGEGHQSIWAGAVSSKSSKK